MLEWCSFSFAMTLNTPVGVVDSHVLLVDRDRDQQRSVRFGDNILALRLDLLLLPSSPFLRSAFRSALRMMANLSFPRWRQGLRRRLRESAVGLRPINGRFCL